MRNMYMVETYWSYRKPGQKAVRWYRKESAVCAETYDEAAQKLVRVGWGWETVLHVGLVVRLVHDVVTACGQMRPVTRDQALRNLQHRSANGYPVYTVEVTEGDETATVVDLHTALSLPHVERLVRMYGVQREGGAK